MLWLHGGDNEIEILGADGIPMGIMPDLPEMPMQRLALQRGDIFALLTDGFYEWARADGEMFGVERVTEVLQRQKDKNAEEILQAIKSTAETFADTRQGDDLTAIIIKKT